jgi:hypothetical protein
MKARRAHALTSGAVATGAAFIGERTVAAAAPDRSLFVSRRVFDRVFWARVTVP